MSALARVVGLTELLATIAYIEQWKGNLTNSSRIPEQEHISSRKRDLVSSAFLDTHCVY